MTPPCELAQLDAAYVLGALSPADREAFAAHLADCDACTRSVQELAGIPGLLAQVDPDDLAAHTEPAPPAPPMLLARVVRAARAEQRRRTRQTAGGAVAATLVLGLGAAWAVGGAADRPVASPPSTTTTASPTAAPLTMTPVDQHVVTATVALVPVAWGTRLDLRCTWADQPAGPRSGYGSRRLPAYSLVVRTTDGRTEQVATWQALPGRTMQLSGATATPAADIAAVEVRTASGRVVLEASV
jgi:anti-sigma factor RsiW